MPVLEDMAGDRDIEATAAALGDVDCLVGDASFMASVVVFGDADCVVGDVDFEPAVAAVLLISDVGELDRLSSSAAAAASLTRRTCDVGGVPDKKQHSSSFA